MLKRYTETDEEAFQSVLHFIENVVYLRKQLPDQVFRKEFSEFRFFDSGAIEDPSFFRTLKEFAEYLEADVVYMLMVAKSNTLVLETFGWFPLISIFRQTDFEDFQRVQIGTLENNYMDSSRFVGNPIVILPDNGAFAIWFDIELAVAGFNSARDCIYFEQLLRQFYDISFNKLNGAPPIEVLTLNELVCSGLEGSAVAEIPIAYSGKYLENYGENARKPSNIE